MQPLLYEGISWIAFIILAMSVDSFIGDLHRMKPQLQLKIGQSLVMTPQLQQAIKLLQFSSLELSEFINEALESNFMLEHQENDEPSVLNHDTCLFAPTFPGSPSPSPWQPSYNQDERSLGPSTENLHQYLRRQCQMRPLSDQALVAAYTVIDAIDESGYLTIPLKELVTDLNAAEPSVAYSIEDLEHALSTIQELEPNGVGARSLRECLLLQLESHEHTKQPITLYETVKTIIQHHLPLVANLQERQLAKQLKIDLKMVKQAIHWIRHLDPKPGQQISTKRTDHVIPDVLARKVQHRWMVMLNPSQTPNLRINQQYASLAQHAYNEEDSQTFKDRLQEAKWLLKSIEARNDTLVKVAQCIVEHQQAFFDFGEEAMKPLVLHDIAEQVGMHESTISRVTTQKYIHTPRGTFELKYFFSSHVETDQGGVCSSRAIQALIKKMIKAENREKPLSDSMLTSILRDEGIRVARRTVAKYREELGIPTSGERKRRHRTRH